MKKLLKKKSGKNIMIHFNAILAISLIIFLSCKSGSQMTSIEDQSSAIKNTNIQKKSAGLENDLWFKHINSKSASIKDIYASDAIKILPNNTLIEGNEAIKSYLLSNLSNLKTIESDTVILANERRQIEYEFGSYVRDDNQKYKHVIIWENIASKRLRVFEYEAKAEPSKSVIEDIDKRRKEWMTLCNEHNAEALINEMYSENTLYYNHKPIVKGRALLTGEYGYMNNERYSLSLKPIISEMVNSNTVFEIGQCSGSYNGKYIIIWKKNESNKWEVFIDSNI